MKTSNLMGCQTESQINCQIAALNSDICNYILLCLQALFLLNYEASGDMFISCYFLSNASLPEITSQHFGKPLQISDSLDSTFY